MTDPRPPGAFRSYAEVMGLVVLLVGYWGVIVLIAYALPDSWAWYWRGLLAVVMGTLFLGVGLGTLVALDSHDVIDMDDYEREFWNE